YFGVESARHVRNRIPHRPKPGQPPLTLPEVERAKTTLEIALEEVLELCPQSVRDEINRGIRHVHETPEAKPTPPTPEHPQSPRPAAESAPSSSPSGLIFEERRSTEEPVPATESLSSASSLDSEPVEAPILRQFPHSGPRVGSTFLVLAGILLIASAIAYWFKNWPTQAAPPGVSTDNGGAARTEPPPPRDSPVLVQ